LRHLRQWSLNDLAIGPGEFVYTPPGEGHTLYAETEAVIDLPPPEPVMITE
jgi:quercetin dioxygenase-like cupin family protein